MGSCKTGIPFTVIIRAPFILARIQVFALDPSKHIGVHYHWVSDILEKKKLYLEKINVDVNGSNMMTKRLSNAKLDFYKASVGLGMHPSSD